MWTKKFGFQNFISAAKEPEFPEDPLSYENHVNEIIENKEDASHDCFCTV